MYPLLCLFLACLTLIAGCQNETKQVSRLAQDKSVQAYFNYRQSTSYIDPYRQIKRPGDNLEAIIVREIENANFSIDLAVQELNLPSIAQALVAKHQSGVQVRLILDNNYSRVLSDLKQSEIKQLNQRERLKYDRFFQLVDINRDRQLSKSEISQRDALFILQEAGISLIDDTADGSKGSGLMHHKFMVVDGERVVTGSANFTLSGIHGDIEALETLGNVNHLLVIENQRVADLFTEEFNYMSGGINSELEHKFGIAKPVRYPVSVKDNNTEITIQFSPSSKVQNWHLSTNGAIAKTIDRASNSIDLALFVFSEQKIADTLLNKQQQGVKIRGVFDPGFAFRYYSEVLDLLGASLPNKRQGDRCQTESDNNPWSKSLKTVGIANLNSGDKLHHKFALIDDRLVISGSQNWSNAANHQNDETLIVINNSTVARHFKQEFDRLYQSASLGLPLRLIGQIEQQKQKCF